MLDSKMRILDPTGYPAEGYGKLAPRPTTLKGKVLGVVDNCPESVGPAKLIPNYLLGFLMEDLRVRHQLKDVRWYRIPVFSVPNPELIDTVASEADVVLNGTGR